jgi:hypothetical protein
VSGSQGSATSNGACCAKRSPSTPVAAKPGFVERFTYDPAALETVSGCPGPASPLGERECAGPGSPGGPDDERGLSSRAHARAIRRARRRALPAEPRVGRLRRRYGDGVSELELGVLAVAWLDGQPLRAGTSRRDQLILRWAAHLVDCEGAETRSALAAARVTARDRLALRPTRPSSKPFSDELTLDDGLRTPELSAALGIDELSSVDYPFVPDPTFVLLQRHALGPHAAELWGTPPRPPRSASAKHTPTGELIGTCLRCRAGVGDKDWTFAAWDGSNWRFSGYTLPGAKRLATLKPLLCSDCAVRVKHKLIDPPDVSPPH